jgi:DNA polymerase III epsilon subunit-like protein
MIGYTNYVTRPDDRTEVEAMNEFLAWVKALGPNVVSVGHNIKSFDRNKIITEGEKLKIDTSAFEKIDIFDTVNFQRQVFKQIAQYQMEQGDSRMARFFDGKIKKIEDQEKTIMVFNGKLQRMMDVYGPGPEYIQLHTAIDDTRQLITAFFNMYGEVKDLITTNEKIRNLSSAINVSRAQKELGTKDIKDPINISKSLKRRKRGL